MAEITTDDGVHIVSSDPEPAALPPESDGAPAEPAEPSADSPPAAAPSDDDDDKPVSPRALRRLVGRLTRQRTEMEQRLGARDAQIDMLVRMLQPPQQREPEIPQGPPKRPRQVDFDSDEAFEEAESRYLDAMVTHKLNERDGAQRMQQQQHVQARSEEELMGIIRAREQEVLQTTPDYYERFEQIGPQLGDTLLWGLKQAGSVGPDLVLYLADNPDEIERLRQIPPSRIGIELGRLLPNTAQAGRGNGTAPPPAQTSSPAPTPPAPQRLPEPPQPVGGGGATATSTYREDMTQQQFDEWSRRMYPGMPYTHRR